jgi:phage gp36-like protein
MGRYLSHDLAPDASPKDLAPFISDSDILVILADLDTLAEQQAVVDDDIAIAEDEIDGILRRASYVTPVVSPTRDIVAYVGAKVAYLLWSRGSGATEDAVMRWKAAQDWAKLVVRDEIQLDIPVVPPSSAAGGGVLYTSRWERRVTPDTADW